MTTTLTSETSTLSARDRRARRTVVVLLIAGFLLAVFVRGYTHGQFDRALYQWGLNHDTCATNGFGVIVCGDDIERYKQKFGVK